jgi:hypothetical protein
MTTAAAPTGFATTAPDAVAPQVHEPVVGMHRIAEFTDYAEAQRLVDRLSDNGFPVEHTRIVGSGIHSVEQVTGRMTKGKAALAGAGTGAWFGLFIGLLFGLFTVVSLLGVVLSSVLIGAFWGALFGFVAHWATRGRRDFSSIKTLEAERYAVEVQAGYVERAQALAAQR